MKITINDNKGKIMSNLRKLKWIIMDERERRENENFGGFNEWHVAKKNLALL